MAEKEARRYLVILSITPATPDRLTEIVPALIKVLEKISVEPIQQAFRSATADHFAYFLRTRLYAREIRALIQAPDKGYFQRLKAGEIVVGGFLRNADHVLVVEVGNDFHSTDGFARQLAWLQHH